MFTRIALRAFIGLLFASTLSNAQSAKCEHPKILSALKAHYDDGSDIFCRQLLATVSMIGTLREDPTLVFLQDGDGRQIGGHRKRKPTSFVKPLPSYVQQYPTQSVSKACSCYVGPAETYTQYRVCEQASTTTTYSTTLTYTFGKPGAQTVTFTQTSTKTKLKYTTAPYPSTCPEADGIDYVASDHSQWERGCKTGISCYRPLGTVKAPSLNACIETCVNYNAKLGYKQCQAVTYDPKTNECFRINEPCYFAHNPGGANVATMRFLPPQEGPTIGLNPPQRTVLSKIKMQIYSFTTLIAILVATVSAAPMSSAESELMSLVKRQGGPCSIWTPMTRVVGNGSPKNWWLWKQVTDVNKCGTSEKCTIESGQYKAWTISASLGGGNSWITGEFAVQKTYETGTSWSCEGKTGGQVCLWVKVAHTEYEVQDGSYNTCTGFRGGKKYRITSPNKGNTGGYHECSSTDCRNEGVQYWVDS
ncbi:hypothetical protein CC86DRAFT_469666 [Ophiobolus disseminans]|uniref:Apple domain-containing protein n=1 Tax=Ophiobolus disseminans TaxID=1469910 RepID=A0A6A6ZS05_9PLEO|nr:hypothetical protein CC86DRAFT_469666 [Ophiobolus disseminans]